MIVCVGGGFNVIGIFSMFLNDKEVKFIGVELVGLGLEINKYGVILNKGCVGILYGNKIYFL